MSAVFLLMHVPDLIPEAMYTQKKNSFSGVSLHCDPGGARTHDRRLKRPLLYQLSYQVIYVVFDQCLLSPARNATRRVAGGYQVIVCHSPLWRRATYSDMLTRIWYTMPIIMSRSSKICIITRAV